MASPMPILETTSVQVAHGVNDVQKFMFKSAAPTSRKNLAMAWQCDHQAWASVCGTGRPECRKDEYHCQGSVQHSRINWRSVAGNENGVVLILV